jgi:hypothetical protein
MTVADRTYIRLRGSVQKRSPPLECLLTSLVAFQEKLNLKIQCTKIKVFGSHRFRYFETVG